MRWKGLILRNLWIYFLGRTFWQGNNVWIWEKALTLIFVRLLIACRLPLKTYWKGTGYKCKWNCESQLLRHKGICLPKCPCVRYEKQRILKLYSIELSLVPLPRLLIQVCWRTLNVLDKCKSSRVQSRNSYQHLAY